MSEPEQTSDATRLLLMLTQSGKRNAAATDAINALDRDELDIDAQEEK